MIYDVNFRKGFIVIRTFGYPKNTLMEIDIGQ
jgi:hypothetical protein